MNFTKFLNLLKQYWSQPSNKLFIIFASLLALIAVGKNTLNASQGGSDNGSSDKLIDPRVDTVIPAGYVLIPIEISNLEALDSLIGSHAIVDLFSSPQLEKRSKKVADNVRLLRAPLNPSQFAVLIAEDDSELFFQNDGPYRVVIQNPSQQDRTHVTRAKNRPVGQIHFLGEK